MKNIAVTFLLASVALGLASISTNPAQLPATSAHAKILSENCCDDPPPPCWPAPGCPNDPLPDGSR